MFQVWIGLLNVSGVDWAVVCVGRELGCCMFQVWIGLLYVSGVNWAVVCFRCGLGCCMCRA